MGAVERGTGEGKENMTELEEKELQQAREYLSYWQRELRLDHWDIEFRFSQRDELGDAAGRCATRRYNGAIIVLLAKDGMIPEYDRHFRNDMEVRMVHELLHIKESLWRDNPKLNVMDDDEWIRRVHEECLDAVAEALVRARRGITR